MDVDPQSQDAIAEVAAGLEQLDSSHMLDDSDGVDVTSAADELHTGTLRVARLGRRPGGYQGRRPLLDIARRLELGRDAIDPDKVRMCLHCGQDVRLDQESGRSERDAARADDPCVGCTVSEGITA